MRFSFITTIVFSFGILLFHVSAFGQQKPQSTTIRPIVVIVSINQCCSAEAWPEAEEKISREFVQGDIKVIRVEGSAISEAERRHELIALAKEYEAAAAIRIVRTEVSSSAGVDLWITDRVTQKTVYRYLPLDDIGTGESSVVAALKTLELYKGSLQEIHLNESSQRTPVPPQIQKMSRPKRTDLYSPKFRLGAGMSGMFFSKDVGPRLTPWLILGWSPVARALLQLEGWFGVAGRDVVRGEDSSSVVINSIVLKPLWEFNNHKSIRPAFGLILGASFLRTEGESIISSKVKSDQMAALLLGVTMQIGIELVDSFWIGPCFDLATMIPQAKLMFENTEVALFGSLVFKGAFQFYVVF